MNVRFGARYVVAAVLAVVVAAGIVTPQLTESALLAASQVAGPGVAEAAVAPTAETPGQATYDEKVDALRVLGIVPTPEILELPDRRFIIELWKHTTPDTEVRASAELAFGGEDEDCVQFIRFGLRAARDRDQLQQARDAATARENRRVRQQAADTLGVPVTEEQLISSDRDFIYVLQQATAPGIVRDALYAAFGFDPAAQRQFLLTGLYDAIEEQQVRAVLDNAQATEEEKARVVAREARGAAAGELGIRATDEVKDKTDENFLRYIRPLTALGTKVRSRLEDAMWIEDAQQRSDFIKDGIRLAHQEDIDDAIKAEAAKDEAILKDIILKAEATLVHPALVAAGRKALATSPSAVKAFIRVGQWNVRAQSVRSMGRGRDMYVEDTDGGPTARRRDPAGIAGAEKRMTWELVPGLADPNCQTFESASRPGHYLVSASGEAGSAMIVFPTDGSPDFARRATFCTRRSGTGVVFESVAFKPLILTYNNDQTMTVGNHIEPNKGWSPTVWLIDGPGPNAVSAITHRWNHDEAVRSAVGNPTGPEVVGQRYRWRPYDKGRMFWTQWSGATVVSEHLLPGYLRVMASDGAGLYGPSVQDDVMAPDGRGRYQVFPEGGGIYYNPDARQSYAVYGEIKKEWEKLGGLTSRLGYPTSDEAWVDEQKTIRRSTFQHGRIDCDMTTGVTQAYVS